MYCHLKYCENIQLYFIAKDKIKSQIHFTQHDVVQVEILKHQISRRG
jgi:hypothetical protein